MPVLSVGLGFGDLPSPLPELPFAEAFVLPPGASSGHLVPAAYGLLHMDAVMAEKATKAAQKAEKAAQPKLPRGRPKLTAQQAQIAKERRKGYARARYLAEMGETTAEQRRASSGNRKRWKTRQHGG